MVGFYVKKVKTTGLFIKHSFITYTCSSCNKKVKELPMKNLVETNYGYKFKNIELSHCSCGCHTNFITKLTFKDLKLTFKKTCRECDAIWNFTSKDANSSGYKQIALLGSPFSGNIKESDLNRCEKCGSRKVTIELLEEI